LDQVTPKDADIDAVVDVRAVFQASHRDMDISQLPYLLRPKKGSLNLTDYEKIFCSAREQGDIFKMRGINRRQGAVIVVRPDQYVSLVTSIQGSAEIRDFFARVLLF